MRIAKEEIFGPVLSIIPFETEDGSKMLMTLYGLGNYLQTDDREKAHRVKKLRSGCVYINGNAADAAPRLRYRQSGNGREGGVWASQNILKKQLPVGRLYS